jgi:hypothetical protein
MGKSKDQKKFEAQAATAEAQRQQQFNTIQQGTPESQAYAKRIAARRSAIDSGNISGASDFISNAQNRAETNRKSEGAFNATPTGIGAIGRNYANPREIATQNNMLQNMRARDNETGLENDWNQYIGDTQRMEQGELGRHDGINSMLMNDASGRQQSYQQLAQQAAARRSQMWSGLIGAGIGGAASVATGGLSAGGRFA